MTIVTMSEACRRIKHAPRQNPISVFIVQTGKGRALDVLYTKTVEAKRKKEALKPYHPSDKCKECGHIKLEFAENWIGDFHWEMPLKDTRTFLLKALGGGD